MNSITVAISDDSHPVPGFDADLAADLFVMHVMAVKMWMDGESRKPDFAGRFVIADDEWVNPGGCQSLTIPAGQRDLEVLAGIRTRIIAEQSVGYIPQTGDVVVFPGAKLAINQTMRYVITGDGEEVVAFKHEDHDHIYIKSLADLRAIGMRKADEPVTVKGA